jgi:hypothetical protein
MKAIALFAFVLVLGACSKTPPVPSLPSTVPAPSVASPASTADTSVPSADSAVLPATATKPDPAAGRTNTTMSREQEISRMPLPGQNNDHSAPLPPAKRASAP